MSIGMVGRKIGMTRVFTENGASIPVTVIQVEANRVTQVKNTEKDGYTAIQVTTGTVKQNRLNKPEKGLFAKTGVEAGRGLWEFRIDEKDIGSYKVGDEVKAETVFKDVKRVDVTGTSKGKGTQGTVKRYNFGTQTDSRQLPFLQSCWFNRSEPDPGTRPQGQEDVRPPRLSPRNRSASRSSSR